MPPIDQDDNDLEPNSSDGADTLDVADTSKPDKSAAANSSVAEGETDGNEILNVVRDVVDEREDKPQTASPAEGDVAGETGGTTSKKEPDNEGFSDVPFHKHPRFQDLIRERNGLQEDATRYQNVQGFLDTHGLSSDEAANGLITFAKAKTDPAGAWNDIKPWVQELLVRAGEVLPDDLQKRVAAGEFSQEAAFEISRSRAKAASVEGRQSFETQQRERREQVALGNSITKTATDWEMDRRIKDPNYGAKIIPLQKEIAYLQKTEGMPKTPEDVLEQLKRAYKAVNDSFKAAPAPRAQMRPAVRPVTGGQVSGNVREAPKSTLEIIRANRRSTG